MPTYIAKEKIEIPNNSVGSFEELIYRDGQRSIAILLTPVEAGQLKDEDICKVVCEDMGQPERECPYWLDKVLNRCPLFTKHKAIAAAQRAVDLVEIEKQSKLAEDAVRDLVKQHRAEMQQERERIWKLVEPILSQNLFSEQLKEIESIILEGIKP